jgi:3'-phosphoadenosine 5'-phosphosulfate sulfotransferase (PAPS reductase)/FAD synthetase
MMNNYSDTAKELNARIKLPFKDKLKLTQEVVQVSLDMVEKPVIASSFGKDSIVLTHLVHQYDNSIPIVFTNTGVCYRETLKYKDKMVKEWNLNLFELKPEQTFWEIVKEHGYPKPSRNSKTGDKREPACCKILKYKPMEKFIKEYKPDLVFVGLVGDEGRQRRWAYICKGGAIYEHIALGIKKSIPIIWWTRKDIWHYHDMMNIPRNPAYKKYGIERTGCIPCTGHIGWEEQLARTFPKMYKNIQKDLGQMVFV